MTINVQRFRILSCSVLSPAAPVGVEYEECEIFDTVWKRTFRVREFVSALVEADPPPPPGHNDKRQIMGRFSFEPGTVSSKWRGVEFDVSGIQIELEYFIDTIAAPRARNSTQETLENGARRYDAVSYCANVGDETVHLTFVQSSDNGSLKLVADIPQSLTENRARLNRLRDFLDTIVLDACHEEVPTTMLEPESGSPRGPNIRVIEATMTMEPVISGASGRADRLYLSDKRTAINSADLMIYLLARSNPPIENIAEGERKRIKSKIRLGAQSVFAKSNRGFMPISSFETELEYRR